MRYRLRRKETTSDQIILFSLNRERERQINRDKMIEERDRGRKGMFDCFFFFLHEQL